MLGQDAIYVGGGSMRNLLAVWREHGVDVAMRRAWERGVVLAGVSAGAMCWFEGGITLSGGAPAPVAGLGFLTGSVSVHRNSERERWPVFRRAIATGALPQGYAVDDGAALVFEGERLGACVASRAGARAIRLSADGGGGVVEREMAVKLLPGVAAADPADAQPDGVAELRALRAARHRWN